MVFLGVSYANFETLIYQHKPKKTTGRNRKYLYGNITNLGASIDIFREYARKLKTFCVSEVARNSGYPAWPAALDALVPEVCMFWLHSFV